MIDVFLSESSSNLKYTNSIFRCPRADPTPSTSNPPPTISIPSNRRRLLCSFPCSPLRPPTPTPSSNPHPAAQTPAPVSKTSWSLPGSLYCDAFKQFRQHSGENLALASLTGNNHRLDMKAQHTSWVAFYTPTSTRFLGGEGWMSGVGTVFVQLLSVVAVYTPSFTRHFTSRLKGHNQLR